MPRKPGKTSRTTKAPRTAKAGGKGKPQRRSGACRPAARAARVQQGDTVDVAVVGAGVSGLYCAWRLAAAGRKPVVYEMSGRIGGRLYSIEPPGMPGVAAELGGMRYLSLQQLVASLVQRLGLPSLPFPVGGPQNVAFVRRRLLRGDDFRKPGAPPYKLDPSEEGKNAGELLVNAIQAIVPGATKLTPVEWEKVKRAAQFGGSPVWTWGFWNLLSKVLSSEAIDLLLDAGGYESMADNWNAAEACQYLLTDFPSDAKYLTLAKGMQALPLALAAELERVGVQPQLGMKLATIARSEGGFTLSFDRQSFPPCVVQAKSVILALPQRALQILAARDGVLFDPQLRKLLDSVMAMPAYKLLAAFPTPWWRQAGVSSGRSTTDLPVRQVYYFATVGDRPGADPANQNSLMLASYTDGHAESYWEPLTVGPQWARRPNRFARAAAGADPNPAPARLVETVRAFLAEMHGLAPEQVPEPYFAAFMDWTEDPYGGGWHFWKANVKVWETIVRMRQPIAGLPLFICGESYANQQGWVEGALCSAEHVMEDHFGLARPEWLPPGYYLGP
jgi:monoamine oxidase